MNQDKHQKEVKSLNLDNLDVQQLEQRLEMAAAPLSHEIEEGRCCTDFSGGCWGYC